MPVHPFHCSLQHPSFPPASQIQRYSTSQMKALEKQSWMSPVKFSLQIHQPSTISTTTTTATILTATRRVPWLASCTTDSLLPPVLEQNPWEQLAQAFLQARCPSCHPTNSVKALKYTNLTTRTTTINLGPLYRWLCVQRHLQLRTHFVGAKFYGPLGLTYGN